MVTETTQPKKSDLGVRTLSAIVMVAVAGTALWLGGWVWTAFVALVALGVLWEWWGLVRGFASTSTTMVCWIIGGLVYVGVAASYLAVARGLDDPLKAIFLLVGGVIATDVGAYFVGRRFQGPKIAPSLSPSKTWSGLIGGCLAAAAFCFLLMGGTCVDSWTNWPAFTFTTFANCLSQTAKEPMALLAFLLMGSVIAIVAQIGDFFESWMKRRAGVKDSGKLIPGHGGLFDRVDGLLAISFFTGLPPLLFHQ
jgi:phosphatidate cytidylyltransferase